MPQQKILIVDDEPNILELCTRLLTREGYVVKTATNGTDALKILTEEPWDLLLTDIRMRGMSGLELIDIAKKHNRRIPVVVITGHSARDAAAELMKLGTDGFVIKPFTRNELLTTIRQFIEQVGPSENAPA